MSISCLSRALGSKSAVLFGLLWAALLSGCGGGGGGSDSSNGSSTLQAYMALGGSDPFGYTTAALTAPSYGDQGYVKGYADWLATQNNGTRPKVINLAVPGETTASLFTGGQSGAALNLNYQSNTSAPQIALAQSSIQAEQAIGGSVSPISIQIGANDLLNLFGEAGFSALPASQQQTMIDQILVQVQANETKLLTQLRSQAPNAKILMLGDYDPLAAVPSNPLYAISFTAVQSLNAVTAQIAQTFHATYVDIYTPFRGHEAEWTYMGTLGFPDGIHCNATGYAMEAQAMIAASGSSGVTANLAR